MTREDPILHVSTEAGYDRWAEIYDDEPNPLIAVEEPLAEKWMGPVAGLRLLDLGCGTGRHSHRFSRAGADVDAIDVSAEMLAKAMSKPGAAAIRFQRQDVTQELPFWDHSFDRVMCGLVLDHINDLDAFFAEALRVCKPNGFALFTVMHPAMMLRGVTARFRDPVTGKETRPASASNSLSAYVMAALAAGWKIDHLSEHVVEKALADRMERAEKYLGWPILVGMRLRPGLEKSP